MKAGDILIAGGITVASLIHAAPSVAAEKQTQVCTEEEQAAFHEYLLEQGLLDMEGILGNGCSEFNTTHDFFVRQEEEPKPSER